MSGLIKTRYTVKTRGRADFRAAVISDTHEAVPDEILMLTRAMAPDVIFLAGDITEAKTVRSAQRHESGVGAERSVRLITELCRIAPVYYGLGNHESNLTRNQRDMISMTGVHLLVDRFERLRLRGCDIAVGAVSPWGTNTQRMLNDFRRQAAYRILICHRPEEYMERYRSKFDDIALAGHAHGGQWRIFGQGIYAPGQGLFPKYTKGFYGNLLVSAGAHNSEVIPRINDPCEILEVNFVR